MALDVCFIFTAQSKAYIFYAVTFTLFKGSFVFLVIALENSVAYVS